MRTGLARADRLEADLEQALASGARYLPETLGAAVAQRVGLATPRTLEIGARVDLSDLSGLATVPGDQVVVKVMSETVAHKSDLGGVRFCDKTEAAAAEAIDEIRTSVAGRASIAGYMVSEHVDHERGLGHELLIGARWTDDFGPVAVLGLGGLDVERIAGSLVAAPLVVSSAGLPSGYALLPRDHPVVRLRRFK